MKGDAMRKILMIAGLALIASTAAQAADFVLRSPNITEDKLISEKYLFNGFGCTGGNVSPALVWMSPPADAKSFAVMVHDPDAPTGGSGWWHWVVINLPANTVGLQQGAGDPAAKKLPPGAVQINTDFGAPGWGGPCPPVGDKPHRYVFTVYALGVEKLDLPANATAALAGFMVNANAIGKASFTARYGRKK
jgi:Raf kinase inhibitor-like YbhB/YbcL family protein